MTACSKSFEGKRKYDARNSDKKPKHNDAIDTNLVRPQHLKNNFVHLECRQLPVESWDNNDKQGLQTVLTVRL